MTSALSIKKHLWAALWLSLVACAACAQEGPPPNDEEAPAAPPATVATEEAAPANAAAEDEQAPPPPPEMGMGEEPPPPPEGAAGEQGPDPAGQAPSGEAHEGAAAPVVGTSAQGESVAVEAPAVEGSVAEQRPRRNGRNGNNGNNPAHPAEAPVLAVEADMLGTRAAAQAPTPTLTDESPEETLISASPFLSPMYAMRRPTTFSGLQMTSAVEFRGAVRLAGQWQFSLYDPKEKRGFWVSMNDENSPYRVTDFDEQQNTLSININGMTTALSLNRPVDTPMAISSPIAAPAAKKAAANTKQAAATNQAGNAKQAAATKAAANQAAKKPASGVYSGGQNTGAAVQSPAQAAQPTNNTAVTPAPSNNSGNAPRQTNTRRRITLPN